MAEESINAFSTLVRYDNPILVSKHQEKKDSAETPNRQTLPGIFNSKCETEVILNSILPPRCWEYESQYWTQVISSTPATRQDVINLQEKLDTQLQQTQARENGICPLRRELYSQCFNELIRQVTINCSERGLLLLRIRDEIAMSIEAYETLYCSSVAFGMRKALQAHEEKQRLRDTVKKLDTDKATLEELINDMKIKCEQNERRNAELRSSQEKKFSEELDFLKKTNSQLKAQLEGIIAPKK